MSNFTGNYAEIHTKVTVKEMHREADLHRQLKEMKESNRSEKPAAAKHLNPITRLLTALLR